jgi:hypothetical protein
MLSSRYKHLDPRYEPWSLVAYSGGVAGEPRRPLAFNKFKEEPAILFWFYFKHLIVAKGVKKDTIHQTGRDNEDSGKGITAGKGRTLGEQDSSQITTKRR